MPDWLIAWLSGMQGDIVRSLAAELRAGGLGAAGLAFTLGALHALTPGHGKAALGAYLIGREARIGKGLRIALLAALLHVISGFVIFLVLRLVLEQTPSMFGRNSPTFTAVGYGLIILAGVIMLVQSLRPAHDHVDDSHSLTAGIGLLPCPLTISVLGFAWFQSTPVMVGVVLGSLAMGVALTIGSGALLAILLRRTMGAAFSAWFPALERSARFLQAATGLLIIAIGAAMLWPLLA
jgi:nickel/cobalt transporter (NicO) family protein